MFGVKNREKYYMDVATDTSVCKYSKCIHCSTVSDSSHNGLTNICHYKRTWVSNYSSSDSMFIHV
jgi:hypothetical protein